MDEQGAAGRHLRGALKSPIVIFALAAALVVIVLSPIFAFTSIGR